MMIYVGLSTHDRLVAEELCHRGAPDGRAILVDRIDFTTKG